VCTNLPLGVQFVLWILVKERAYLPVPKMRAIVQRSTSDTHAKSKHVVHKSLCVYEMMNVSPQAYTTNASQVVVMETTYGG